MMNKMIVANLVHRPIRSLISIIAIALEVTLILLIVGLCYGMLNDSKNRTAGIGADVIVQPPGSTFLAGISGAPVSIKIANLLARVPHVTAVSPVIWQVSTGGALEVIDGIDLKSFEAIGVVIGVSVVIGFIVIFQAMYTAVMERTREIGILKSMGASKFYVVNVILRETILLAIGGIALGMLCSTAGRLAIRHKLPLLTVVITSDWLIRATIIAIVGAIAGALYPAFKAAQKDPIDALAYE